MHALVIERQMKRYCSKTEVFKHCQIDSGFCMNRTHPAEFVVKPEGNVFLCQIISKIEFLLGTKLFSCFPKTG